MQRISRRPFLAVLALCLPALSFPAGADEAPAFAPVPASEVVEADLVFLRRPVIIFADSPNDPAFVRQMELLARTYDQLAARDVILITDTDPATPSALRKKLHPRGFSLVLMDKDWKPSIRKPLPWDGREIVNSIDKMPIARTEALERNPAGR
jgi:Domain of unknown function (DUF4174)